MSDVWALDAIIQTGSGGLSKTGSPKCKFYERKQSPILLQGNVLKTLSSHTLKEEDDLSYILKKDVTSKLSHMQKFKHKNKSDRKN